MVDCCSSDPVRTKQKYTPTCNQLLDSRSQDTVWHACEQTEVLSLQDSQCTTLLAVVLVLETQDLLLNVLHE